MYLLMHMHNLSPTLLRLIAVGFFVIVAFGLLWQTISLSNSVPLHDWDEAIYAQVAKEWAQSPSLTLHYNSVVWFEKPPLPFIVMGGLWALLGPYILPLRLVSALLGLCCVVLVFLITKKITRRVSVGLVASAICITSAYFLDRSSIINVDIYLACGWLLYMVSEKLGVRMLAVLLGVGSKSLLGFFPLLVDAGYETLRGRLNLRKVRDYMLQLILGLSWHAVMYTKFGNVFFQSHFLDHMIARVAKPIELHFGDKFFYVTKIWEDVGLFGVLAIVGFLITGLFIFRNWKETEKSRNDNARLPVLLVLTPLLYLILLTLSKAKLTWYVFPLIPFVAIFAAVAIAKITHLNTKLRPVGIIIVACCTLFFVYHISSQNFGSYTVPDKTVLAKCVETIDVGDERIAYLVSPQERQDAQVIEAANLQIGSSFIYGGAPAFVFYAQKPVTFFYSKAKLSAELEQYRGLVVHNDDLLDPEIASILQRWGNPSTLLPCKSGPWQLFSR